MKRSKFGPVVAVLFAVSLFASASFAQDESSVWTRLGKSSLRETNVSGVPRPASYEGFVLNKGALQSVLGRAPEEFSGNAPTILSLPMPDGSLQRFEIEHSLVVEPGLLAKFPELGATYRGYGIDDPTASVRIDLLPSGFHAIVLSSSGTFLIDPATGSDAYFSYDKQDGVGPNRFECLVKPTPIDSKRIFSSTGLPVLGMDSAPTAPEMPEISSGTTLRTYRLALALDYEYCGGSGGYVPDCLAKAVSTMNRVNGVYERELAIHMNLVANNDMITFAAWKDGTATNNICGAGINVACTATNDPYANTNGVTMLSQNQSTLDARIGTANYDIGHVFSTGGGGVAYLGVPCGANKAGGVTGLPNPSGDAFAIDYVAHEMGHQFGANHTFNGTTGNCGGANRSSEAAFEPGSGISIMGYAGVCSDQDLASHSIDKFHVKSIEEIIAYSQFGLGDTCAIRTATQNVPPAVSVVGGTLFTVPKGTPFALTALGSDANNDPITYDWQEYDNGGTAGGTGAIPNADADGIARPIFRSYYPSSSPTRTFPSLTYILNYANNPPASMLVHDPLARIVLVGELLPQIARTMNFQVMARDNRANGGGIRTAIAQVSVDNTSGPFVITSPNAAATFESGSPQTVDWNVANTDNAVVNATYVDIYLSTDGGNTFPLLLASNTPNDGSEEITIPYNVDSDLGRIKIKASNGIFFDISDANFSIKMSSIKVSGRIYVLRGRPQGTSAQLKDDQTGQIWLTQAGRGGMFTFVGIPPNRAYHVRAVTSAPNCYNSYAINSKVNVANLSFVPYSTEIYSCPPM